MRGEGSANDMEDIVKMHIEAGTPVAMWTGGTPEQLSTPLPKSPSEGFRVFAGEALQCERSLVDTVVQLANESVDGKRVLRVSIFPIVPEQ